MRLLAKILLSNPVLGLLLTLVIFAASQVGCPPLQLLDQQLFDRLIGLRAPARSDRVVMVSIDLEESPAARRHPLVTPAAGPVD